jgi:molybdenum cofactor cytidylyltransferase
MKRVAGLILAAGTSQRMGSPKALLRIYGRTFLEHIASEAQQSNLTEVKIVLGSQAELILERLPQLTANVVINPEYEQGQLSSLIRGLKTLEGYSIDGLMLFLVDHPFVNRDLINELLDWFSSHNNPLVIPTFKKQRGHPIIFAHELFPELINAPVDAGAIIVVRKYQDKILHVETGQAGILLDIDTPEAYQEYVVDRGISALG